MTRDFRLMLIIVSNSVLKKLFVKSALPDSIYEIQKRRMLPFLEDQVVMAAGHNFNMILGQKIFERLLGCACRNKPVLCLQKNIDVVSVPILKVS